MPIYFFRLANLKSHGVLDNDSREESYVSHTGKQLNEEFTASEI